MTMQDECRVVSRYPIDPHRAMKRASWYVKQSNEFAAMRAMVKGVLTYPHAYRWSCQGFGFLRTYLPPDSKRFRLNVWHNGLSIPNVSTIHDHPWSFDSWIISGEFRNLRFVEDHYSGDEYNWMRIMCGEQGKSLGHDPARIRLRALPIEHYFTGDKYHQDAEEIHQSAFTDGTVTLNDRTGDTEMPRVFWPAGLSWVDAKPREATEAEIATCAALALERWA
jgi:hypothetical protein